MPRARDIRRMHYDEATARHPPSGAYDGCRCTCMPACAAACDGECGCEACVRAWIDSGLDVLIGATWGLARAGEFGQ
jgi:hypothetical protein